MTDREFKAEIKKGLQGTYLLYGDEEYLKKHYIKEAKAAVVGDDDAFSAFNFVNIDDEAYSAAALENAVETVPMMAEKTLVVCNVKISALKEKEKQAFLEVISHVGDYTSCVLLIVCPCGTFDAGTPKKNKPSAIYKSLTKYAVPVEFSYQGSQVLKKWVLRHFEKEGLRADEKVLSYIVEASGPDMFSLENEISKLICYAKAKGNDEVFADDAKLLCSDNGECETFALTNAIVSGDRAAALEVLKESKEKRQKAPYVLAKITADFTNMYSVALYMKSGYTKSMIASKMGIHEFRVSRYMDSVRNTDISALKAALTRCKEADLAVKSSGIDYIALERLICTMPAKKSGIFYK